MANFQSKYVKLCSIFCPGIWEGRPRYNFIFFNRHALLWLVDIILEEMLVTSKSDPASKVITWWWQTCVLFCLFCIFFACSLCFLYFKNIFWWKIIVIRPLKCISWWWQTCVLSFTSVSNFPAFGRHQAKLLLEKIFASSDIILYENQIRFCIRWNFESDKILYQIRFCFR